MSNYSRITKHPLTGKFENAEWLDDYYGKHRYGVRFIGSNEVFVADSQEWEFDDEPKNPMSPASHKQAGDGHEVSEFEVADSSIPAAPAEPSDINVTKAKPQVTKALHNLPAAAAGKLDNILIEYAGRFSAIASMGRTDMVVQDIKDLEKRLATLITAQIQAAEARGYERGRNAEVEILGATDGCICMTCKEVRHKLAALGDNHE